MLSVTPTQFDQGLPFAGLAELIGQFPEGADSGLPGPQRRALAVALQRAEPDRREADALAVRGLLTQLTESGPVALIIDDVQWLDQASVGSLSFALRRISVEPHRLSVLVTTRPDPGAGADLIRCLPGPRHEFSLPPLEDWAIGQLLRQRLGPRWTPPVSAGVAGASGGNPFLALEIARAMQADLPSWRGSAQHGHDLVVPVPPSLADLLRERVARLPQDSREVLLLVSAAGLRAVNTYIDAGDQVAAHAALDKASALAAVPKQQAQMLERRAKLADHYSGMRSLAEQALRLAPKGTEVRAEILLGLCSVHRMEGNGKEALRLGRMAVEEAAAVKRQDVQLTALNELLACELHWGKGQPEQSLRDIKRLAASSAPDLPAAQIAWTHGFFAAWNDETAEEYVRDGIKSAVDAGRYGDLSDLYICLVLLLIRGSRVRDAQAALDEADRSGAWTTSSFQEDMARVLVKEYAGDLDGARELAQGAIARSRISGSTYWLSGFLAQLGFVETSARNWHAALEALHEIAEIFASTEMVDLEQLLWGVDYADAALQVGAEHDVEVAISVLRRQGASGRPEAAVAADRCQALLGAARGDVDEALGVLRKVVEQPGSECPFEAARSRLALGQLYRRAGYKGMASEALNAAAVAFGELGIPRWAQRARDEASRVGLHPTTSTLTETERRVAELVGSGRSNQETAAELFISVKTVEANLTRVYRKLSVRSRTEFANHLNNLASGPLRDGTDTAHH